MTKVIFKKTSALFGPVLKLLKKEGNLAVDMHCHTEYSMDGVAKIENVLKKCRKFGFGVAITDHNQIKGAVRAWKLKKSEFIIPGIEISCRRGIHTLLYFLNIGDAREFYDKHIKKHYQKNPFFIQILTEELYEKAAGFNCLVCAPHPYAPGMTGIQKLRVTKRLLRQIDFIEGFNACNTRVMNKKSIAWAKRVNKPITGGSDGHCTEQHGTALTITQGDKVESFLENIRKKSTEVIGHEEDIFHDLIHLAENEERYMSRAHEKHKLWFWLKDHYYKEIEVLKSGFKRKDIWPQYHIHHKKMSVKTKQEVEKFMKKNPHYKQADKYMK